jgi:hypothetical protein
MSLYPMTLNSMLWQPVLLLILIMLVSVSLLYGITLFSGLLNDDDIAVPFMLIYHYYLSSA